MQELLQTFDNPVNPVRERTCLSTIFSNRVNPIREQTFLSTFFSNGVNLSRWLSDKPIFHLVGGPENCSSKASILLHNIPVNQVPPTRWNMVNSISGFEFTLDSLSNRTKIKRYFPLNAPTFALSGNTYSYNSDNQLTTATGKTFAYDDNGNLLQAPSSQSQATINFTYDYNNQLTAYKG